MFVSLIASFIVLTNGHLGQVQLIDTYNRVASEGARLRQIRQDALDAREDAIRDFRQNRDDASASAEARREAFQGALDQISDARKRAIVANLAEKFTNINARWTTHWTNVLTRLTQILDKLTERFGDQAIIDTAQAAIDSAQAAVNEQAAKVYEIEIDDEASVGQNVKALIHQFRADTKAVFEEVKAAKTAVREAFTTLKSQAEGGEDEE